MTFARLLSPLLLLCALLMTAVGSFPAHASGADLLSSLGIGQRQTQIFAGR